MQIYKLSDKGIESIQDVEFNGSIVAVEKVSVCKVPGKERDMVFILTKDFTCLFIEYENGRVLHTSKGELNDRIGLEKEDQVLTFVHWSAQFIGLIFYENILKVVPIIGNNERFELSNPFNVRIRHNEILNIMPLCSPEASALCPIIGVFYEENDDVRAFECYEVSVNKKDMYIQPPNSWHFDIN